MATSLARAHRIRTLAAREVAYNPYGPSVSASQYELHLMQLAEHRLRLKQLQSGEAKAALKRELLPEYNAYLLGVLEAAPGTPDDVLATLMVWSMDAGEWSHALILADYVLRHRLPLPDRFKRTAGCLIAEEIAEAALRALSSHADFPLPVLARTKELTQAEDMPDEVRAKLYLASGRLLLRNAQRTGEHPDITATNNSIADLKRAIALHGACGGKKDLERAERLLKKHSAPSGNPSVSRASGRPGTEPPPPSTAAPVPATGHFV